MGLALPPLSFVFLFLPRFAFLCIFPILSLPLCTCVFLRPVPSVPWSPER